MNLPTEIARDHKSPKLSNGETAGNSGTYNRYTEKEAGLGSKVAELIQNGNFNEGDMRQLIRNHFAQEGKSSGSQTREESSLNREHEQKPRPVSLMSSGTSQETPSYKEMFKKLRPGQSLEEVSSSRDAINVKKNGEGRLGTNVGLTKAKMGANDQPEKPFRVWQKMIQAPSPSPSPFAVEAPANRPQYESSSHDEQKTDGKVSPKTANKPTNETGSDEGELSRFRGPVDVDVRQFPFHALLKKEDLYICGAIIVSNRWLLTAGQCVNTNDPWNLQVAVGDIFNSERPSKEKQNYKVVTVILHKNHSSRSSEYDIALLETEDTIKFGETVAPVKLPKHARAEPTSGEDLIVSGYGTISEGVPPESRLKASRLSYVNDGTCSSTFPKMVGSQLCATCYDDETERCGCQGDIGGPLTNTAGELVGITSNGLGCLSKQKPGLYTQVSHFLEWMATNVGRHEANQLLHHQP